MSAVVLLGPGASPEPLKQLAEPYPRKSIILTPVGQVPVREEVPWTRAILPVLAEKLIGEAGMKSAVTGRFAGCEEPAAF